MRRRNGGAGVAPAPLWLRTQEVRVALGSRPPLKTKGCLRKKAGTVRMKGGESRPDHGDESLRLGPDETVPGWKTPQWSAGRRRARKARGHLHQGARLRGAPIGAPLPHMCEGKGNDGGPRSAFTRVFAALWPTK